MEKAHRLFFALVPDAFVRDRIAALQAAVGGKGRPVPPANFHVTLAFLGMQSAASIPLIRDVAAGLALPPCSVRMDRLGAFPRAGVLWLGLTETPSELAGFQAALMAGLQDAAIGHDPKPWTFHLTLYRRLRMPLPRLDPEVIEWRLTGFDLVESAAARRGVQYRSIGHWPARA